MPTTRERTSTSIPGKNTGENFFSVDFHTGGPFNTVGRGFYRMDHRSLFTQPTVDPQALSGSLSDFRST